MYVVLGFYDKVVVQTVALMYVGANVMWAFPF